MLVCEYQCKVCKCVCYNECVSCVSVVSQCRLRQPGVKVRVGDGWRGEECEGTSNQWACLKVVEHYNSGAVLWCTWRARVVG